MKPSLRIIPLGGLGEIGMNMMVIECGNDALIVDCGVKFPESTHHGIDLIIPDFSYVLKIKDKIRGVLLTHGHEDHIGAIPYLLRHIQPRIFGTRFTMALVAEKFKSKRPRDRAQMIRPRLTTVKPNQKMKFGCFQVEFLQVSHSIIEGMGLVIDTPQGRVVHTGDFKIDDDPYHGKRVTLKKFAEIGNKGVTLLMSDSTNVEREGKSLSEDQIKKEIYKICKKAKGRIVFSVFATNIRRIEQMLEIAKQLNRRAFLSGRSIMNNMDVAMRLNLIPKQTIRVLEELDALSSYADDEVVVICTGSQAEFGSSLWRMAKGEHRQVKIGENDLVILSSRFIPGNEKAISHMINDLYRHGAEVLYSHVANVHVSGHAYANELRRMIQAVKPKYFIPVHGEYRHLVRHAQLAKKMKIPEENIFVCENGDRVLFEEGDAERLKPIQADPVFVDGKDIRSAETFVLKDRRQLSETGVIFVLLVRNEKTKAIISGPDLFAKGVLEDRYEKKLVQGAKKHLMDILNKNRGRNIDYQEMLRIETRRFFKREVGKKPVVIPLVINL